MAVSECPCSTFSNAMFNRCQDLISSEALTHSTFNLIGSCNKHRTYKATKIHTLTPLTYELFFQNSSKSSTSLGPGSAVAGN